MLRMANCCYIPNSTANHLRVKYKWPTVILMPDCILVTVGKLWKYVTVLRVQTAIYGSGRRVRRTTIGELATREMRQIKYLVTVMAYLFFIFHRITFLESLPRFD